MSASSRWSGRTGFAVFRPTKQSAFCAKLMYYRFIIALVSLVAGSGPHMFAIYGICSYLWAVGIVSYIYSRQGVLCAASYFFPWPYNCVSLLCCVRFLASFVLCFRGCPCILSLVACRPPPPRRGPGLRRWWKIWWSRPAPLATMCWWLELATGCAALERGTPRHPGEGYPHGPYTGCPATSGSVT